MSIGELVDILDPSLVLELYGYDGGKKLVHKGTFNLNAEASKSELLGKYEHAAIKRKDMYKAYVLVYLKE